MKLQQEISKLFVKIEGRVNIRDLLRNLMGVLHYILTHDWVDAFIQSALQVERILTFLL